jgi:transcriptional regulator with XRE-family HTH domain
MKKRNPRGRKPNLEKRQRVAELRQQGLTLTEIGAQLGISKQAVKQLLDAQGCQDTGLLTIFCDRCKAAIARLSAHARPSAGLTLCRACLSSEPAATFGQRLRGLRIAASMTQRELAQRAGLPRNTIGQYERDQRQPTGQLLADLKKLLGPDLEPSEAS